MLPCKTADPPLYCNLARAPGPEPPKNNSKTQPTRWISQYYLYRNKEPRPDVDPLFPHDLTPHLFTSWYVSSLIPCSPFLLSPCSKSCHHLSPGQQGMHPTHHPNSTVKVKMSKLGESFLKNLFEPNRGYAWKQDHNRLRKILLERQFSASFMHFELRRILRNITQELAKERQELQDSQDYVLSWGWSHFWEVWKWDILKVC